MPLNLVHYSRIYAALAVLLLTACVSNPPVDPPVKPSLDPTPTVPGFDPPTGFDMENTVLLLPLMDVNQGSLDGHVFYTLDGAGIIWGIDVTTGLDIMSSTFSGLEGWDAPGWICWEQIFDDNWLYTVGLQRQFFKETVNEAIGVSAVDRETGDLNWLTSLPTSLKPGQAKCGENAYYRLSIDAKVGLVVETTEGDKDRTGYSYTFRTDSNTGYVQSELQTRPEDWPIIDICQSASDDVTVCLNGHSPTQIFGMNAANEELWTLQTAVGEPDPYSGPVRPLLFHGYLYSTDRATGMSVVLDTTDGTIVASGDYPQPVAVNEYGMVFCVDTFDGHLCRWAPAIS